MIFFVGVVASACGGRIDASESAPPTSREAAVLAATSAALVRAVDPAKELVITDPSVIESPLETTFDAAHPSGTDAAGAFSFGRLVHNMLPRGARDDAAAASKLVFDWLHQWESDEQPNAASPASLARPRVRTEIIDPWKRASGCDAATDDAACTLDMGQAPFRLIAVVYRPDLRILAHGNDPGIGGEGRFVFQLRSRNAAEAAPLTKKMTVIFEYSLPIFANVQTLHWAQRFHALGDLAFGPSFNAALRELTSDFSGPDKDLRRPNGNALDQLRTNELRFVFPAPGDLGKRWELREFHLGLDGLRQAAVAQEPSRDFDAVPRPVGSGARSGELGDFIVANADAIRANTHRIPDAWLANSSLVGSRFPAWGDTGTKNADGTPVLAIKDSTGALVSEELRHAFALQTCAGCHNKETNTKSFLHLTDRRTLDPADPNDNANLPPAPTADSERQTVLSFFLQSEIATPSSGAPEGGERYADYVKLLGMKAGELREKTGRRACPPHAGVR